MRFVARIRPLFALLLLCFGNVLLAVPASAANPECSARQAEPSMPAPESHGDSQEPSVSDESAESASDVDARRRGDELNLRPASVALDKTFELESLRLRKEDRRRCRPPNR